ncbi:hypothetical protein E1B28_003094 [Marasmius oreades]|uniref:Uncharacterized protein n=1 Tax=Marasmius oreades TaxID=181124 RepID=A0A9P7RLQ2_9AGAR|nr:uncharacterized protein E1B28_003094 [Marasmius oreades]KAG7085536.1 hypothetical protein E1B28_003094 [Marasmius oreades]
MQNNPTTQNIFLEGATTRSEYDNSDTSSNGNVPSDYYQHTSQQDNDMEGDTFPSNLTNDGSTPTATQHMVSTDMISNAPSTGLSHQLSHHAHVNPSIPNRVTATNPDNGPSKRPRNTVTLETHHVYDNPKTPQ